jgi:SAM-dependent methyltransferase
MRLCFPHTQGNRGPIWDVLSAALPDTGTVLELASGSGEHVATFAGLRPGLTWQPSDVDPEHLDSIAEWTAELPNVLPPLPLDAAGVWPTLPPLQAMVVINLIHIAPWEATLGLLANARRLLVPGGLLYLYGTYRQNGAMVPSNHEFDRHLREQNASWGVRDLEAVEAAAAGLTLERVLEMPSNNLSVLFRPGPSGVSSRAFR